MRIIAGEHKGRRLKAPEGQETRPTADRVRESLMSSLESARAGFQGAVVLDAFAGSGALGLEALSRGAQSACFFECESRAQRVLADNVKMLGYGPQRARVRRQDVLASGAPVSNPPFDLVFLDPPYATEAGDVFALLAKLADAGSLAQGALIAYEHASSDNGAVDRQLEAYADTMRHLTRRTYRKISVDTLAFTGSVMQGGAKAGMGNAASDVGEDGTAEASKNSSGGNVGNGQRDRRGDGFA